MNKIKILPQHIAELIAAGEVVQRPVSVVKELVENAIDSGAEQITVEIKNGGKTFIRVTDNGCGINSEDLPFAFQRHATSKIGNEKDLEEIKTMGFRGEALAAIAAVSKAQAISCTSGKNVGASIEIEGGNVVFSGSAGCPPGTTVIVRDLFFNTPARMKFLKKDSSEASAIEFLCQRVFLSRPEISFKLIKDGQTVLQTTGDGSLKNAVYAIFGSRFSDSMIPVSFENHGIQITGLLSNPNEPRANRTMQTFFLNKRLIKSKLLYACIEEAYRGKIISGKHPACFINISVSFATVDVNVHPEKTEVRFAEEKKLFDALFSAVMAALDDVQNNCLNIESDAEKKESKHLPAEERRMFMNFEEHGQTLLSRSPLISESSFAPVISMKSDPFVQNQNSRKPDQSRQEMSPYENETLADFKLLLEDMKTELGTFAEPEEGYAIAAEDKSKKIEEINSFKYIGEVFKTYLLVESNEELLFIDKHAAHERLIFEKLKIENEKQSRQILLDPIIVTLPASEHAVILENEKRLEMLGFFCEDYGNSSVIVREIPLYLIHSKISEAVFEVAEILSKSSKREWSDVFENLLHSVACRSAIKGGDENLSDDMKDFALEVTKRTDLRNCPHGRPVIFSISKKEIEKKLFRS